MPRLNRKSWCTQRLCQISLAELSKAIKGLEQYGIPTADEIENAVYLSSRGDHDYSQMIAKQIYYILQLKTNISSYDTDELTEMFRTLREGKNLVNVGTQDGIYYDRNRYDERSEDLKYYDDQEKDSEDEKYEFEYGEDAETCSEVVPKDAKEEEKEKEETGDFDIEQIERAISHVKSNDFNTKALLMKIREKGTSKNLASHRAQAKLHCLLELLEGFDGFNEIVEERYKK